MDNILFNRGYKFNEQLITSFRKQSIILIKKLCRKFIRKELIHTYKKIKVIKMIL
jgi:hypothetical protein